MFTAQSTQKKWNMFLIFFCLTSFVQVCSNEIFFQSKSGSTLAIFKNLYYSPIEPYHCCFLADIIGQFFLINRRNILDAGGWDNSKIVVDHEAFFLRVSIKMFRYSPNFKTNFLQWALLIYVWHRHCFLRKNIFLLITGFVYEHHIPTIVTIVNRYSILILCHGLLVLSCACLDQDGIYHMVYAYNVYLFNLSMDNWY